MEAARDLHRELKVYIGADALRDLTRRKPLRHFLTVFRQFLFLGAASLCLILFTNPLIVIPAALLSGFTIFNFTILLHEQLHGLIFSRPHPRLWGFLGHLYAFWSGISRTQFTRWHLDHHAQLGSDTLDPKRHHLSPKRNSRLIKLLYFTPALFPIYFRAAAKETAGYPPELRKQIRNERLVAISGHLAIQASLFFLLSPGAWLRAYVLPVFIVFPIAFALNRLGQHYAIKEDDPAGWTTWVRSHWFWNFVYINSNHHLEHHYFPGVPFYNLPRLQKLLVPFYRKHDLKSYGYGQLLWGYIVKNNMPHTTWDWAG